MNILNKIVLDKRREVDTKKNTIPTQILEQHPYFEKNTKSLAKNLRESKTGIIAEFKRKSPSKLDINLNAKVADVAKGYENAGVTGMSVLTDEIYFGGKNDDLLLAKTHCNLPLLRKDFIIDEYQIIEAKAIGADVILLIASILTKKEIKQFSEFAKQLHLDVLLEVHNQTELEKSIIPSLDMIGVNNRDLKTFDVNLETSIKLSKLIPDDFVKVSESGISDTEAIKELKHYGFQGFLIGENFMKTDNPGASAKQFIKTLEA